MESTKYLVVVARNAKLVYDGARQLADGKSNLHGCLRAAGAVGTGGQGATHLHRLVSTCLWAPRTCNCERLPWGPPHL